MMKDYHDLGLRVSRLKVIADGYTHFEYLSWIRDSKRDLISCFRTKFPKTANMLRIWTNFTYNYIIYKIMLYEESKVL